MTSTYDRSSTKAERAVAATYRADWGRLLSLLVTRSHRLDLAEDALGEAFARAGERWPSAGVPSNPAGWLYTTANRLIIVWRRSEAVRGRTVDMLAVGSGWPPPPPGGPGVEELGDERLDVILLCCHPALRPESRSPLALRLVNGTSTEDIARLFLVPTPTMAARITRAKKKIVHAGIPLSSPVGDELRLRLDEVCRTIYLAFTAGYTPGRGPDLLRADLAGEAVELAAVVHRLVPDAHQVRALLGLLLLQHARRDARQRHGSLVTLADQNRSLWRREELRSGVDLVVGLPAGEGYSEELRLQGLIAVEHARAAAGPDTRWATIALRYAGLALLRNLDALLPGTHRLPAVRAELARRAGRFDLARQSYDEALVSCTNEVERRYLAEQLASIPPPIRS